MNNNTIEYTLLSGFSEKDRQQVVTKVWELMKKQAYKYNGLDSSSMSVEEAEELMGSIIYSISLLADSEEELQDIFLNGDLDKLLKRSQEILNIQRNNLILAFDRICLEAPAIHNAYYVSTMKSIGAFLKAYNIYFAAHRVSEGITYPLIVPVPEDIKGISYILEYLRHICLENRFIKKFDPDMVQEFLRKIMPEYRNNYFNICEYLFVNALGKNLCGGYEGSLFLTEEEIHSMELRFSCRTEEEILTLMDSARRSLFKELNISDEDQEYFEDYTKALAKRAEPAAESGNLKNIFVGGNYGKEG